MTNFKALAEALPQIVWIARSDGSLVFCNERWFDYTGFSETETYAKDRWVWPMSIHLSDFAPFVRLWEKAGKNTDHFEIELRLRGQDRLFQWFLCRGQLVFVSSGETQWVGTFTNIDITKRLEVNQAQLLEEMQEKERRIESIVTTVPGVVWEIWCRDKDQRFRLDFVSDHAENVSGYTPMELLNDQGLLVGLIHPEDKEYFLGELEQIIKGRRKGKMEIRIISKRKKVVWLESQYSVTHDEVRHLTRVCGVAVDVTKKKAESERKDEFLSIASHELKTPVTSIRGFTQLLVQQADKLAPAEITAHLGRLNVYVDKLVDLIGELLDVSRLQTGKMWIRRTPFDIYGLIRGTIDDIQVATTSHQIIFENVGTLFGENDRLYIYGDQIRIGQVLINLLTNAIKYSPEAGMVIVRLATNPDAVIISIQDFGPGISADKLPNVFRRYYQVYVPEHRYAGLGIGLYISKKIITHHHGRMWVESELGKGSTFYFSLPIKIK
ncbi:MAG: ATP-binding protein [bacterium]